MSGNFWNDLKDGKLPTIDTNIGLDIETVGKVLAMVVLVFIVIFLAYKIIIK
jgi:hypothetical protein